MSEIPLNGLPADNPLGFLAAIGALVTVDRVMPGKGVALSWSATAAGWRPVLHLPGAVDEAGLTALLYVALHREASSQSRDELKGIKAQKPMAKELQRLKDAVKKAHQEKKAQAKALGLKKGSPELAELHASLVAPAEQAEREARQLDEDVAERRRKLAAAGAMPDATTALGSCVVVPARIYASFARSAASEAKPCDRRTADFAASFGCELIVGSDGKLQPSQMSKHNGSGGKNMLSDMAALMQETSKERLAAAVFRPWDYKDSKRGLGWDPADVRPYAYQGMNPDDGEGAPTMHGANLLAYEALPLLPTAVRGTSIRTTGTVNKTFTWPVWKVPLGMDVVRSLLSLDVLHREDVDRRKLAALGVSEVYRVEHYTFGKYPRFRPARPA